MKKLLIFAVLAAVIAPHAMGQSVPSLVNYQGTLNDSSGNPLTNGNYEIEFRIWNAASGGTLVWGEIYQTYIAAGGQFNVLLGSGTNVVGPAVTNLLYAFDDGNPRFLGLKITKALGVSIPSPTEIAPRQQLVSSPFAIHADSANRAGTFTVTDWLTVEGGSTFFGSLSVTNGGLSVQGPNVIAGYGTIPIGGIIMWSGAIGAIPDGWALCDGSLGTPDLRDRFVVGAGSSYAAGATGGTNAVTLASNQVPAHVHAVDPPSASTASDGAHTHTFTAKYGDQYDGYTFVKTAWNNGGNSTFDYTLPGTAGSSHSHSIDITQFNSLAAGGGASHENRPPYYALAYIMRVK